MNTEQIFATEALLDESIVGIHEFHDEIPPTQCEKESVKGLVESDATPGELDDVDVVLSQQQSQVEIRRRALLDESIPLEERLSQSFCKRFQLYKCQPWKQPAPKPLTQDQLEMCAAIRNVLEVPIEADYSLYNPKEKFERPKDETPEAVLKLTIMKGFVSAKEVYSVMPQSQPSTSQATKKAATIADCIVADFDDIESEVFTHIENDEKEKKKSLSKPSVAILRPSQPKVVRSLKEAVLADFEDLDNETLSLIDEQQKLNESLGSLSQVLHNSQRAAEIIESALIQSAPDLDVTKIDLKNFPSDDEVLLSDDDMSDDSIKCTEEIELEFEFLHASEQIDPLEQLKFDTNVIRSKPLQMHRPGPSSALPLIPNKGDTFNDTLNDANHQSCSKSLEKINLELSSGTDKFSGFSESFSLESGKSKNSKKDARMTPETGFDLAESLEDQIPPSAFVGFGLASGRNVQMKETTINRFTKAFDQVDQKFASDIVQTDGRIEEIFKVPTFIQSPGIRTPGNAKSRFVPPVSSSTPESSRPQVRRDLRLKTLASPQVDDFDDFENIPAMGGFEMGGFAMGGFATASGQSIKYEEKTLRAFAETFESADEKFAKEVLQEDFNLTPAKPSLKKIRLDFGQSPVSSSPFLMDRFKRGINRHSTPMLSRVNAVDKVTNSEEESSIVELGESLDMTEDIEEFASSPKRKKVIKTKLLNKFNDSFDSNSSLYSEIASLEQHHQTLHKLSEDLKSKRKQAIEDQRKSIQEKADSDRAAMAGSVFMMKSSKNRMKLKDYVGIEHPKDLNRHNVTFTDALSFKFDMQNYVSEEICKSDSVGISVGDNARLLMNEQSKTGIEEIKLSFLASPGVDPTLASEKWIENAFKMILLKLVSLENSFEKFNCFEVVSPDNVLLQMKYRYDREIDRNHRSAIKNLVELNDVPCRRMVLKVVDIYRVPVIGVGLELSDGWYSIKCLIDVGLANAVDRGKIKIGTKLVTSCAELIDCNGCDPLELVGNVRLKIFANSTRRASWDMKLGFCANPHPIYIPLDSVLATGSTIGKLNVVVTHVYQMIYVDSSGDKKEFRSEKLHHRIQNRLDVHNFSVYEAVAHQVQQEEMKDLRARIDELTNLRLKIDDMTPENICDLLDYAIDSDDSISIQNQFSNKMLRSVQEIRDKRRQEFTLKVRAKLGEKSKQISQLLKFRVVDAMNPKKTALVSWWSPTEEMLGVVKQGQGIEIIKSSAAMFSNEIQITAGKSSIVKVVTHSTPRENFMKFYRHETRIFEIDFNFKPQQDEFDVACVVVLVDSAQHQESVKVYVADEQLNILCINFWSTLSANAFDDVIVEGKTLYAKNLQWRASHAFDRIPQAFVITDTTLFLTNPTGEQRARLDDMNSSISNLAEFLIQCNHKIAELNSGNVSVNKENQGRNAIISSPVKASPLVQRPALSKTFNNSLSTTPKNAPTAPVKRRLGMFTSNSFTNQSKINSPQMQRKKIKYNSLSKPNFN